MTKDVFFSYSNKDYKSAFKICGLIERRGIRCWIAPRDVKPTPTYAEQIVGAIESCPATVLILSENSNVSTHVRNEIERVVSNGKSIILVRIQDIKPSRQLELYVSAYQWIDAIPPRMAQKMDQLAEAIRSIIQAGPMADKDERVGSYIKGGGQKRKSRSKVIAVVLALTVLTIAGFLYIQNRNTPVSVDQEQPVIQRGTLADTDKTVKIDSGAARGSEKPSTASGSGQEVAHEDKKTTLNRAPAVKKSSPGTLQIITQPWAMVILDGKEMGASPIIIPNVTAGNHSILFRLNHEGYPEEVRKQVYVKSGETLKVVQNFTKK